MENDQEKKLFFKELLSKQQKFEESGGIPPHGPLYQYDAIEKLDKEKEAFESGQKIALLGAIRICANHNMLMPEWVQKAYIASYDQVLSCKTGNWNDAFGKPYPNKKVGYLRIRRKNRYAIYERITGYIEEGDCVIDDNLFEGVGLEFGVGKTLCKELYYEMKKARSKNSV